MPPDNFPLDGGNEADAYMKAISRDGERFLPSQVMDDDDFLGSQFGTTVCLPSGATFWMKATAIPITAMSAFWMRMGPIALTIATTLRMRIHTAAFAIRNFFWVSMNPMVFPPWKSFWVCATSMFVTGGPPTFASAILGIIGCRSYEEMGWSNACSFIAAMADKEAGENRTIGQFIGNTVG